MRIFYSGLPDNLENAPEALIKELRPDIMLSFWDFVTVKDHTVKAPFRFKKHLHNQRRKNK